MKNLKNVNGNAAEKMPEFSTQFDLEDAKILLRDVSVVLEVLKRGMLSTHKEKCVNLLDGDRKMLSEYLAKHLGSEWLKPFEL